MSFRALMDQVPIKGRIRLKGGQTQGHVEKPEVKITVDRYTPSLGKGSEYAAKLKAEEDRQYSESVAVGHQSSARVDLTSGNGASQLFEPEELTSIGTLPNLRELNREELTQVYQNYNFSPVEPTEQLEPIHNEREQILRLIESNQACIIKGPTGCGKSTQIPQFILDSYVKRGIHCNIVVTQPRRIAAITITQHVCSERKWQVGNIVGYQVALEKKVSEDTRLLYCTTGVLLEKLIASKQLNDYTHIILDEVHERDVDMDFLMLIVKIFSRTNSPNVKVVLMSATMDVSRFAKYFEVSLRNEKQPAPYYEIKRESKFTVQVHYLDALKDLGNIPLVQEDEPTIAPEMYMLVLMMIRAFNKIDAEDYKYKRSHEEKSAVLVFLPGLHQIETLFDLLSKEEKNNTDVFNFWLCPLHSSITKDEQEKVRKYAPPGKRKIILSTNIAESSITIPDVKYVIDFCLTKHLVADPVTGFSGLHLAWASHTNCLQREGRVGRVQDGRVYRMVPRSFYQFKMSKECVPEMQRCPLDIVVLKCKRLMEDECPLKLIGIALDPPDLSNYEKTIVKLKEIGGLLTTCRGKITDLDGDLTFMGQVMSSLPLDIHLTKLILLGHIFDVLEDSIIMACAMAVRNIFSEQFKERLGAYNNKLVWADSSESDSIAYLNAYLVWRQLHGLGKFKRSNEDAWGRRYMLQIKHLQEVAKQEDDIKKRLRKLNIQVVRERGKPLWSSMEKPLILKLVLAGAFYPHFFSRSAQNHNAECEAVKMLSGHSPYSCVYLQNMPHPAPLYMDQVRQLLSKNGVSDDVQLFHDDSRKLVVQFNSVKKSVVQYVGTEKHMHLNIPGEIVMAVYRAIKLRQLNVPLPIKTLPASAAKEQLSRMSMQSSISTLSLSTSEKKPWISLGLQFYEIDVTHVESAGNFYGQLYPNEDLLEIYNTLNKPGALCQLNNNQIVQGLACVAPFVEEEDPTINYYRAIIKKVFPCNEDEKILKVEVFFIDYGNSLLIPANLLRELVDDEKQREFDCIPPCAVQFVLAEIGPSIWSDHSGEWSKEANLFVTKKLLNKRWIIKVYSQVEGVASVFLLLSEKYTGKKSAFKSLNDELLKLGFAIEREESYISQINHTKRKEMEHAGVGKEGQKKPVQDDTNSVARSFSKDLLSLPTTSSRVAIPLRGPNSPLEMKLFSMVRCSTQKEVKVEWNSVNSVLLDSNPSDPHERLLVSGSISQSPDGRKLTLNHTTVLPNLHGLAALICLIFAPSIELRTNESFSRYTGALCGLGVNEGGVPMFPENDMEIIFDVKFDNSDIIDVNKLRYWMNERYCSEDAEDMSEGQIIQIQKNIKDLALSLLRTDRPTTRVYHNPNPFMWGRVPEDQMYDPFPQEDARDFSRFIYKLHKGLDIQPEKDRNEIENLSNKLDNLEKSLLNGLTPRFMYCDLCDAHFEYWNQLRMHMTSSYHLQLAKWLHSRAKANGLTNK